MQRHLAPGTILVGILIPTLLLAGLCIRLAVSQPWLGVDLAVDQGAVVILRTDATGPLAGSEGAVLVSVGAAGMPQITLAPDDIVEEPDTLEDGARLREFFDQQRQIHDALQADRLTLVLQRDDTTGTRQITPGAQRPVSDLPWSFWTQIFVGIVGLLIGAWVVAVRQRDLAAWMLLLAGGGLALSAQAAAIYSTRELAIGMPLFGIASRINGVGTLLFGIGMVTLFLVYPRRLVPGWALATPAVIIGGMITVLIGIDWPENVPYLQQFVAIVMVVLLLAIFAQVWANRHDPAARAMMGWLGLTVAIGAGGFVLTAIVPYLLNREPVLAQSTAFLFFLLIYAGVALGVARYRLFDLADWSWGILSYAIGVGLLLAFDAFLVFVLSLERLPALSLSLALVCLTYLPLRNSLADRLRSGVTQPMDMLYRRITAIANTSDRSDQFAQIQVFWQDLFRPVSIKPLLAEDLPKDHLDQPQLADNGCVMLLPALAGFAALKLSYANKGTRLFSSRDLEQARTIGHLLDHTITRHRVYAEGIAIERSRINRDMHDNIGILLLSALHCPEAGRKNTLIRQTLTDLREIVSNPLQEPRPFKDLVADLRAELSEVLAAAQIDLDWQDDGLPEISIPAQSVVTLRALLREGISNVLRHSGAKKVMINLTLQNGDLDITMRDDGHGFDPAQKGQGNGLRNLRTRLAPMQKGLTITSSSAGTTLSAKISIGHSTMQAAE